MMDALFNQYDKITFKCNCLIFGYAKKHVGIMVLEVCWQPLLDIGARAHLGFSQRQARYPRKITLCCYDLNYKVLLKVNFIL